MTAVSPTAHDFAAAKLCLDHLGLCSHSVLLHKGLIRAQLHEMRTKESDLQPYQQVLVTMSSLCSTLRELLEHEESASADRQDQEPGGQKRARTHDEVVGVRGQGPCETRAERQLLLDGGGNAGYRVLSDRDLVQHVMSMLAGPSRASREDVGRLSLVCRLWRDVGRCEAIWRRITMQLFPINQHTPVVGIEHGVLYREYIQSYGRALVERRVVDEPLKGVDLHVELWDEMDGATLFSAIGPAAVAFSVDQERTGVQVEKRTRHCRRRITAADRDPQQHRYADIEDFVRRAHEADMPSRIRLRVMVRDRSSGRWCCSGSRGRRCSLLLSSWSLRKMGRPTFWFVLPPSRSIRSMDPTCGLVAGSTYKQLRNLVSMRNM